MNKSAGCIFCRELKTIDGVENLILIRGKRAFVILNRYPYTSGHLMIVPYAHQPSIEDLDTETRSEIMELATNSLRALAVVYGPHGYNLGINIGDIAGAGVAEHVHLHVVPRWSGDTNFMSAVGGVRVLPEALEVTFQRLKQAIENMP